MHQGNVIGLRSLHRDCFSSYEVRILVALTANPPMDASEWVNTEVAKHIGWIAEVAGI